MIGLVASHRSCFTWSGSLHCRGCTPSLGLDLSDLCCPVARAADNQRNLLRGDPNGQQKRILRRRDLQCLRNSRILASPGPRGLHHCYLGCLADPWYKAKNFACRLTTRLSGPASTRLLSSQSQTPGRMANRVLKCKWSRTLVVAKFVAFENESHNPGPQQLLPGTRVSVWSTSSHKILQDNVM
jgi:hypothetical protein